MSAACLHVMPVLKPGECRRLLRRFDKLPPGAPNSMNRYGAKLDGEWSRWADALVAEHVAPVAKRCYGMRLRARGHYAFLVRYQVGKQRSLAPHVDSSDVTLNLCLGESFSGGDVEFENGVLVGHAVGRALVHRGDCAHRATPLERGRRVNLIVWCRRTR